MIWRESRRRADDQRTLRGCARVGARARERMTTCLAFPTTFGPLLGGRFLARAELWVAEEGAASVSLSGSVAVQLTHLYTDPADQNGGVATALLKQARAFARSLELWVFQKNKGARRFYERTVSISSG
jgi:GNAT superfamily N-acetyltransferase